MVREAEGIVVEAADVLLPAGRRRAAQTGRGRIHHTAIRKACLCMCGLCCEQSCGVGIDAARRVAHRYGWSAQTSFTTPTWISLRIAWALRGGGAGGTRRGRGGSSQVDSTHGLRCLTELPFISVEM